VRKKITYIADLEVSLFEEIRNMCSYKSVVQCLTLSAALLITLLFWPSAGALAQATMATVRGTVRDQTGVPIPGTMVMAKNVAAGVNRTASSNEEGQFEILQLDPGTDEVQAA